jgi:hypothetical protein
MKPASPIVMAYPGPPRRAAGLVRYLLVAILIVFGILFFRDSAHYSSLNSAVPHSNAGHLPVVFPPSTKSGSVDSETFDFTITGGDGGTPTTRPKEPAHPIDTLIEGAEKTFRDLLHKESHDINTAAAEYRKRRGRHPPPGFDAWFKFAQDHGAVMVEEFFDQIYHDLGPFWGLPAKVMRKESTNYEMNINIRNHNASAGSDWFWTQIWLNLTQTIEHILPDMDIPLNAMDEPRIIVPWEQLDSYMAQERASRKMPSPEDVITEFQQLPLPGNGDIDVDVRAKNWETKRMSHSKYRAPPANKHSAVLGYRSSWLSSRQFSSESSYYY